MPDELLSKPYLMQEVPLLEFNLTRCVEAQTKALMERPTPRLFATHLQRPFLNITKNCPKVVVVLRNPKDTLVSYYHFYRMTKTLDASEKTWEEFFQMFKDNALQGGDMLDFCRNWWVDNEDANILFLTYEEMKRDTVKVIQRLAEFCNRELTQEQLEKVLEKTSFLKMKENPATNFQHLATVGIFDQDKSHFFRKGEVGDWREYFSEEQSQYMDQLCQEKCGKHGLYFDYN